jgi:hypothetical protein
MGVTNPPKTSQPKPQHRAPLPLPGTAVVPLAPQPPSPSSPPPFQSDSLTTPNLRGRGHAIGRAHDRSCERVSITLSHN